MLRTFCYKTPKNTTVNQSFLYTISYLLKFYELKLTMNINYIRVLKICIVKITYVFCRVTALGPLRSEKRPPYLCIKFVTTAPQQKS
jgi:hypothetical protein